jgi:hypothetical protein
MRKDRCGVGHTGGAHLCHRSGCRRRVRLGRALLARLVFIVTEVANLPFDAVRQGCRFNRTLNRGDKERRWYNRSVGLTEVAHHR